MNAVGYLLEPSPERLAEWLEGRGHPRYRARQIRRWLFARRAASFAEMSDLPRALREELAAEFRLWSAAVAAHRHAADGSEKLLLRLEDGEQIECVLLRNDKGHATACVSTQVGCGMGCVFCASGLGGFARNLAAREIIEQLLRLQQLLVPSERLSHVVVMGMGEPLANLEQLLPALRAVTAEFGISARRITISSVGLPKGMRRLADENCQYHLAVSLHAPDDELRSRLVPANRQISLAAVLEAADYYFARTGRRVTYEYVLLAGVNDRPAHARRLAALLAGRPALINLIPYNPVVELPYRTPTAAAVQRFREELMRAGLNVEVRRRKGDHIDAACGQLRRIGGGTEDSETSTNHQSARGGDK
jgi:23S rRNA (adenine2503-C2)-methyltransferase